VSPAARPAGPALVAIGVTLVNALPQAGGAADEALVEHPSAARGTHEGLVVKPGREQRRSEGVGGTQIECDRRPRILTARYEALGELGHRAGDIGLAAAALPEGKETIRLFDTRRQEPAGSVVFEAAANDPYPVRQQRGGQRIATKAAHGLAVE
jgi:hypothetical protein